MPTSGPNYGTSFSTAVQGASLDWTNPSNVGADDGSHATITAAQFDAGVESYHLFAQGFGFSIPTDATIDGITVEIEREDGPGAAVDFGLQLLDATGAAAGDNKADTVTEWGTLAVATYGGAADLWGLSLTPAWVNDADFGVRFSAQATANNTDIGVDYIRITVHYTEAASPAEAAIAQTLPALTQETYGVACGGAQDNFDRADEADFNGSTNPEGWTWTVATGSMALVGNEVQSGVALTRARAEKDLDGADMYAEGVFYKHGGDGSVQNANIALRMSDGTNAELDMYVFQVQLHSANGTVIFFRTEDGASTNLGSTNTRPGVGFSDDTDYRIRIEARGTVLTGYIDGVEEASFDDSSPPGTFAPGLKAGFALQDQTAAGYMAVTDWSAGCLEPESADGAIAQTLPALTQDVTTEVLLEADIAQTLPALTQDVTTEVLLEADIAQTLPALIQAVDAAVLLEAAIDQTLPALTQDVTAAISAGPVAHYDATLITGLSDGDPVSTWPDESGFGRDLTQSTSTKKPTYKTGIQNGNAVVRFDDGDVIASGSFATGKPRTLVVVGKQDPGGGFMTDGLGASTRHIISRQVGSPDLFRIWSGAQLFAGAGAATLDAWHIFIAEFNGASSLFWIDGTQVASGDAGSNDGDGLTLGGAYDQVTNEFLNGDLGEVILYDRALDTTERQDLEASLDAKWFGDGSATAAVDSVLPALTQDASAESIVEAILAQDLPAVTQAAVAELLIEAALAQDLPALTQDATAAAVIEAAIAQALPALEQSATAQAVTGANASIDQTLPALTTSVTVLADGLVDADTVLPALTQAVVAEVLAELTGASTLPALTQDAEAFAVPDTATASVAQTLPALTQRARVVRFNTGGGKEGWVVWRHTSNPHKTKRRLPFARGRYS